VKLVIVYAISAKALGKIECNMALSTIPTILIVIIALLIVLFKRTILPTCINAETKRAGEPVPTKQLGCLQ